MIIAVKMVRLKIDATTSPTIELNKFLKRHVFNTKDILNKTFTITEKMSMELAGKDIHWHESGQLDGPEYNFN